MMKNQIAGLSRASQRERQKDAGCDLTHTNLFLVDDQVTTVRTSA